LVHTYMILHDANRDVFAVLVLHAGVGVAQHSPCC
jgi:hypothetical protein